MGYVGTIATIPLGQLGLITEEAQANIPPNAAIKANNVSLNSGKLEKSPGSSLYTSTALESDIVALHDWWPTPSSQRLIAATANGKIWKDTGDGTWSSAANLGTTEVQKIAFSATPDAGSVTFSYNSVSASVGLAVVSGTTAAQVQTNLRTIAALANVVVSGTVATGFLVRFDGVTGNAVALTTSANTLTASAVAVTLTFTEVFQGGATLGTLTPDAHFVAGGAESSGRNRKLFFFSSTTQCKVLDGDGSVVGNVRAPAADWTSNYPTFGIIYQNRLIAFGNSNQRHTLYISTAADHEDFTTTTSGITGGDAGFQTVFAGEGDALVSAIVYKGLLILFKKPAGVYVFDWRDTTAAPSVTKLSDSFGIASPHAALNALDDMFGLTNTNRLISMKASDKLGSLESGDLLKLTKNQQYIRETMNQAGAQYTHAVFYPDRQQALFTMRGYGTTAQNRILVADFAKEQPRLTVETKDSPLCLTTRKDSNLVLRPIYGTSTGYVYTMDSTTRAVGSSAYTGEFQTPYIDFSYLDASLSNKNKLFDFLQVTYIATGNVNLYVDTYIDGNYMQTLTYPQVYGAVLGTFVLDVNRLGEITARSMRKPLKGSGRAISFRFYNSAVNESFKIERIAVSFRVSGEQSKSSAE